MSDIAAYRADDHYAELFAELRKKEAEIAEIKDAADSVLFHQLCCLGGCHESMASMARLAKLIGFEGDPATMEELEAAQQAPRDHGETHDCWADTRRAERKVVEAAEKAAAMQIVEQWEIQDALAALRQARGEKG